MDMHSLNQPAAIRICNSRTGLLGKPCSGQSVDQGRFEAFDQPFEEFVKLRCWLARNICVRFRQVVSGNLT